MKKKIIGPLILATYIVLTLILTYPLVLNFSSHIPGSGGDNFQFLWNLWWIKKALIEIRTNPLYCDYIFYPLGHSLAFHTFTLFNGLAFLPFQFYFDIVTVNNIIIIFSFVLSAYGAYLLAEYLTKNKIGAFIAGLTFAFCPYKFAHLGGHFNLTSTEWIPFYILYLIKANEEKPQPINILLAGLFLALTALCDYYYLVYLLIFTLIYFLWFIIAKNSNYLIMIKNLSFIILVFGILFSPVLATIISELHNGSHYYQMGGQDIYVADLRGYISPSPWHPFLGAFGKYKDTLNMYFLSHGKFLQHSGVEGVVFAGYTVLFLSIYCMIRLRKDKYIRLWAIAFLAFMVLSFGPYLHVNGEEFIEIKFEGGNSINFRIPLPYLLLQYIPFINGVRVPGRFNIMVMLSAAILVSYSLREILSRIKGRRKGIILSWLICALILFEYLHLPIELYHYHNPEIFEQISTQRGEFQIWEINAPDRDALLDQVGHQKRILYAFLARHNPDNLKYYLNLPFIKRLLSLQQDKEIKDIAETIARDRMIFKESMHTLDIQYIIVHLPYESYIINYLEKVLDLAKIYQDNKYLVYKIIQEDIAKISNIIIRLGDPLSNLYLGRGWLDSIKWNGETYQRPMYHQPAEIFFRLENPLPEHRMVMTMKIKPIISRWGELKLYINNQYLSSLRIMEGWQKYLLEIPPGFLNAGLNVIKLRYSPPYTKSSANAYIIGITGIKSPVNITVSSAGLLHGNFGHIMIKGKNVSLERRGYNLAIINPKNGKVEEVESFDTFADARESEKLARYIQKIPNDRIVALSVKDEASANLTPHAIEALKSIGASEDLGNKYRWGHALIGVKGAGMGTALESVGNDLPQTVSVGKPPDLALVFEYIEIKERMDHAILKE